MAQPEPIATVMPVVKMDESTNNSMSEEDLIKLRKINFKKKVSGEK